jgi:hypothetical protein
MSRALLRQWPLSRARRWQALIEQPRLTASSAFWRRCSRMRRRFLTLRADIERRLAVRRVAGTLPRPSRGRAHLSDAGTDVRTPCSRRLYDHADRRPSIDIAARAAG